MLLYATKEAYLKQTALNHYLCTDRVYNEKIDSHEITSLLFQPVGYIKVFFYAQIYFHCLSPCNRNCEHYAMEIVKNYVLSQ